MASNNNSSPKEIADTRDTRLAVRYLEQHESYLALLKHAHRIRLNNDLPSDLEAIIQKGEAELQGFRQKACGHVAQRRRSQKLILTLQIQ
jgi:hypothetical protein